MSDYVFELPTRNKRLNLHTRQIRIYFSHYNMVGVVEDSIAVKDIVEDGIKYILSYMEDHPFQFPITLIVHHPNDNGGWTEEKRIHKIDLESIIIKNKIKTT